MYIKNDWRKTTNKVASNLRDIIEKIICLDIHFFFYFQSIKPPHTHRVLL
jgi:hypothetical protein